MNKLTISLLLLLSVNGAHLHAMQNSATGAQTPEQCVINIPDIPLSESFEQVDLANQGSAAEQKLTPPRVARPDTATGEAKQGSPSTERKKLSKRAAFKKALKEKLMSLSPLKREAVALLLLASAGTALDVAHHLSEGSAFESFWVSVLVGISDGALSALVTRRHDYWKKAFGGLAVGLSTSAVSDSLNFNWTTGMVGSISYLTSISIEKIAKIFGRTPGVIDKICSIPKSMQNKLFPNSSQKF